MVEQATSLFEGRNLKEVLSRLRRIVSLLGDGEGDFEGLARNSALNLDRVITRAIIPALDVEKAESEPVKQGAPRTRERSRNLKMTLATRVRLQRFPSRATLPRRKVHNPGTN